MNSLASRMIGMAGAAGFVGSIGTLMIMIGRWDTEVMAIALVLSLPLYVALRDGAARRKPAPAWVPPWER